MAIRQIITNREQQIYKKSRPVKKFDEKLWQLLDDMAETMYEADGVGLAAVQVAMLRQAIVIDTGDGLIELINPEIISKEGEQNLIEGCLSIPGEYYETVRPEKLSIKAQDRYGEWHRYDVEGFKAACFSHEIDHLSGILFTQRLNPEPGMGTEEEKKATLRARKANAKANIQIAEDVIRRGK